MHQTIKASKKIEIFFEENLVYNEEKEIVSNYWLQNMNNQGP
jgi:hypothetical protein